MTVAATTLKEYSAHAQTNSDESLTIGPGAIGRILAKATPSDAPLVAELVEAVLASPIQSDRDEVLGLLNGWFD